MTQHRPLSDPEIERVTDTYHALIARVSDVVTVAPATLATVVRAMVAGGHVLLNDLPGTGKTSLAKALAGAMDASYGRVQFTPDLLPADVTGSLVWNQRQSTFEFHPGAVFSHVVLADEINRASAKTQAALLEVMEEHTVTVDGTSYPVPEPFVVIATQNPADREGTYRLPEAQMDRFMVRCSLGYPSMDAELGLVRSGGAAARLGSMVPAVTAAVVEATRLLCDRVHVSDAIVSMVVRAARSTRELTDDPRSGVLVGVSPRAVLALVALAKVSAATQGRSFVIPEDVVDHAVAAWGHRLCLDRAAELDGLRGSSVVADAFSAAHAPA